MLILILLHADLFIMSGVWLYVIYSSSETSISSDSVWGR